MGSVQFVNPNCPEQPAGGVYRWYCVRNGREFTLYIGSAGKPQQRKSGKAQKWPSTLWRGISHLSSDELTAEKKGQPGELDTDFIVGSAIRFFKSKGYDCRWEHVCNDANQESGSCDKYKPILQDCTKTNIKKKFRPRKPDGSLWDKADVADVNLATQKLNELFGECLKEDAGT